MRAGVVQFGVLQIDRAADGGAVEPDQPLGAQPAGAEVVVDEDLVELEDGLRGVRRGDLRPVEVQGTRDLCPAEVYLAADTAAGQPQAPVDPGV